MRISAWQRWKVWQSPGRGVRPAALAIVALVASLNFLTGLGRPVKPIWDENYYLTATQRYTEGRAQFASHPPLGLMLIAAGSALLDSNRHLDTEAVGRKKDVRGTRLPAGYDMRGVRIASGVFAVIGAVLLFILMLELSGNLVAALLLSNLYVFDNGLVAHLRAAHLDAFQLTFALAALLCFAVCVRRDREDASWIDFALGVFCGLAMMVKLNAVVLLLLGVMLIIRRWRTEMTPLRALLAGRDALIVASGCVLAIFAVMTVHVAVSAKPPDSRGSAGQKDEKFISATYRTYLSGDQPLSPSVVVAAGRDYLRFIRTDFRGIARSDRNGSTPLQWPFGRRTITYRWDFDGNGTAYIQLLGNPVGWWMALSATIVAAWLLVLQWWRPRVMSQPEEQRHELMGMLLLLYLVLLAVHGYLGQHRVLYLYHYFLALLSAFCLVPLVLREAAERWRRFQRLQMKMLVGLTTLLLASFVFYSPLTFHRPLSREQCELRNALQKVVVCQPVWVPPLPSSASGEAVRKALQ